MCWAHRSRAQLGAEAPQSQSMHSRGSLESGPEGWVLVSACGTLVAPLACIPGCFSCTGCGCTSSRSARGGRSKHGQCSSLGAAEGPKCQGGGSWQSTGRLCQGQPRTPALTHLLYSLPATCTSLTQVNIYSRKWFLCGKQLIMTCSPLPLPP